MKPRKRYTEEFKAQALELCATGKPVAEVARDLCVSIHSEDVHKEREYDYRQQGNLKKSKNLEV